MRTNQIMIRGEGFIQRTNDGYFSATELVKQWNSNNSNKKQLGQYQLLNSTNDYVAQLKKEGIERPIITGRGKGVNSGTWVHPKIFIDLAMWVSVEFKSKVIDYVLDGLIKSRHDAGDYYNEMCASIMERYVSYYGHKPNPLIYINEANMIKSIVNADGVSRNEMSEDSLNLVTLLQKNNTLMINKGMSKEARIKRLTDFAKAYFL